MAATVLLGNEKQILGAARSLRRAMRRVDATARAIDNLNGFFPENEDAIGNDYQRAWWEANEAAKAARDRLIYFAETGHKNYPHRSKS